MIALLGILSLGSCTQATTPARETTTTAAKGTVLGKIVTHDADVAIVGGGRELRVVVRRRAGSLASRSEEAMTLAELRERQPDLHAVVTSALAGDRESPKRPASYVDATLDLQHLN